MSDSLREFVAKVRACKTAAQERGVVARYADMTICPFPFLIFSHDDDAPLKHTH